MKVVVFSDLHAHNYREYDKNGSRLNNCVSIIGRMYALAHEVGAEAILFGGDLYDQQKSIPTSVVNEVVKAFDTYAGEIPFLAITGNHDQATKSLIDKPAVSALTHLDTMFHNRMFWLIDNDVWGSADNDFLVAGVPYYEYPEHFKEAMHRLNDKIAPNNCKKRILMIHQTPSGLGNTLIPFDIHHDDPVFEDWDLVLCGHIHEPLDISSKFRLINSPLHRDLSDEGQDKGALLIDTETMSIERISFLNDYPQFIRRPEGQPLNEWERNQYVVPIPIVTAISQSEAKIAKDFSTELTPQALMENYWKIADETGNEALLKEGLSLLT